MPHKIYRILGLTQGLYTLLTALWALVDLRSFMEITGPKTDTWLVKTVAVLLIPISLCFLTGIYLKTGYFLVILMGITSSAGLAFIDFYYTATGVIKWIYRVDGYLQILFLLVWIFLLTQVKGFKNLRSHNFS